MRRLLVLVVGIVILTSSISALSLTDSNLITIGENSFRLELESWKRVSDYVYQPVTFSVSSVEYRDSLMLSFQSPEMLLILTLKERPGLGAKAWLATANLQAQTDVMIRNLNLTMAHTDDIGLRCYKGPEAINRNNQEFNRNIVPYTDKVIEYSGHRGSFWIVASNYADCYGVEYITPNSIVLYDNKLHYFRQFRQSSNTTDLPRDCMPLLQDHSRSWSFLIFEEQPRLLWINRWLGDRRAAVSITNDADGESYDRLAAVYYGTNNPDSPLYMNQGIIANNLKISHTTFGENYLALKTLTEDIMRYGNAISYHTYANNIDPPGSNAQALLNDMLPYNIRLWIDHGVPTNPEDLAWNGLVEGSPHYIGDVINQSNIEYAWMADTPASNPFNAFDDPWRLPHLLYELTALEKPVWFFGRTRTQTWEYLDQQITIDMKNQMTPENLDRLLIDRGLNICYTHFCFTNWTGINSFYITTPEGEYQVRTAVENMLQMLDHYQTHRGLWVETIEVIFDRMLAIEELRVISVLPMDGSSRYRVTLRNGSQKALEDLYLRYTDQEFRIPHIAAGDDFDLVLYTDSPGSSYTPRNKFVAYHNNGDLLIKDLLNPGIDPVQVQIFNLRGQLLEEYDSNRTETLISIPLANYSNGIYFVRLDFPGDIDYKLRFSVVK